MIVTTGFFFAGNKLEFLWFFRKIRIKQKTSFFGKYAKIFLNGKFFKGQKRIITAP